MTKLFTMGFFAVSVLAVGMMVLVPQVTGVPEGPAQAPVAGQSDRGDAVAQGRAIFQHDVGGDYAICMGTQRLASLREPGKAYWLKFSAQETANLSLCTRNTETGNYDYVQDISGVSPGDFLHWNSGGQLGWTR